MLEKQFIFFLMTGGIAAGLNWGSRFLFSIVFSFEIAVILAFIVGLISGFILMRLFVFENVNKPFFSQIGKYTFVNLLALIQTFTISIVMAEWVLPAMGLSDNTEPFGHLIGVVFPVLTSYFGHKYLTFR